MCEMKKELERIGTELRYWITEFIVPLQTIRAVKEDAFLELHHRARALTFLLKGHERVPKPILKELYAVSLIIRAEASYFKEKEPRLNEMAAEIECCFGQILLDETPEDRTPGVPRII